MMGYIYEQISIEFIIFIVPKTMCQCLVCDCWWCNWCGVCCAGWHYAFFCLACWLCKPIEMQNFDPDCCKCLAWTGYGGNFFCYGNVCCAPESVKMFSRFMNGGGTNVVVVNTNGAMNPNPY